MKKQHLLLVGASILFVASCTMLKKSSYIKDLDLGDIYVKAIHNSYEWMYSMDSQQTLEINGQRKTKFRGGFKGIFLYSGLKYAIADYLKNTDPDNLELQEMNTGFYSVDPYEVLSGHKLFKGEYESFRTFGNPTSGGTLFQHYNPLAVEWAVEHMIPEPTDMIGDKTAQEVYDFHMFRFCRYLAMTYEYLHHVGYDDETKLYEEAMQEPGFHALDYLAYEYGGNLEEIDPERFPGFTQPMAIGFWMRRNIDGSHEVCWNALSQVMNKYDKDWFSEIEINKEGDAEQ